MPRSSKERVVVVGGGAAGVFAAITCAEAAPHKEVVVLEKGPQLLAKVRISGGGRCNVTHARFEARDFAREYPRGERALIGPLTRFQASDTVNWFERRGVKLKTEGDGRMFPTTDRSATIIDCLCNAAHAAGVKLFTNRGATDVKKQDDGFRVTTSDGKEIECARLLLATGGVRTPAMGKLVQELGHNLEPPVPSLFTFHIEADWVRELAGVSVQSVEVAIPGTSLRERGPLLFTHWGLSGPAILRLSAWGARELHKMNYHFPLQINWTPGQGELQAGEPSGRIANSPPIALPKRLWAALMALAEVSPTERWGSLSKAARHRLLSQIRNTRLLVSGKSLNKDEFVTCGGVRLSEVDFKTMESRVCAGLYLAGEILDIDGITGGFNFQAAWTTGWIAGNEMAH